MGSLDTAQASSRSPSRGPADASLHVPSSRRGSSLARIASFLRGRRDPSSSSPRPRSLTITIGRDWAMTADYEEIWGKRARGPPDARIWMSSRNPDDEKIDTEEMLRRNDRPKSRRRRVRQVEFPTAGPSRHAEERRGRSASSKDDARPPTTSRR